MPTEPDGAATEFAAAFATAVTESGLSLDAIRRKLAAHGHQLSVATLSYWRSGRRRPERASSLAALDELEPILGVPKGSLVSLLPGRAAPPTYGLDDLYELNGPNRLMADLVERLGLAYDDGLERLSFQDIVELDESGRQVSNRMRMLVRSQRDGIDRFPISVWAEDDAPIEGRYTPPALRVLIGGTLGRTLVSPDDRVLMGEVVLDHELVAGETLLIEVESTPGARPPVSTRWERGLLQPLRLYLVSVSFHPDHLPTTVERYERALRSDSPKSTPVLVTSPSVTELFTDVPPGVAGLTWRW